jgi:uncharacterized protein with HEPN domain
MVNAINEIEKSTKDVSFETFSGSYEKINSVAYDVLIIGEAVDKIPKSVQDDNPEIPWRVMNDIRNKHIHEYHTVKPDKLWKMAKLSLPKLKPLLENMLKDAT